MSHLWRGFVRRVLGTLRWWGCGWLARRVLGLCGAWCGLTGSQNAPGIRVSQSSLEGMVEPLSLSELGREVGVRCADSSFAAWRPRHLFNIIFRLDVAPAFSGVDLPIDGAYVEVLWRR